MGNGRTILFGLPGVAVCDVERRESGERTVHVVTTDPSAAACPVCGVFSTSVRQHRTTSPKDLPYGEAPLRVRWRKAQYRCREPRCPRKAFTESIAELPPGARVTGRLRRFAGAAVGDGGSVARTAERLPLSWPTVHRAFVSYADSQLTEPAPPAVLGIDETRRGRPRWTRTEAGGWQRLERFETNFVDLAGTGGLLGQTAGRTGAAVVSWLDARGETWKAAVQVVAMDPHAGYRAAVAAALPNARIDADRQWFKAERGLGVEQTARNVSICHYAVAAGRCRPSRPPGSGTGAACGGSGPGRLKITTDPGVGPVGAGVAGRRLTEGRLCG